MIGKFRLGPVGVVRLLASKLDSACRRGFVGRIEDFDANVGNLQSIHHRLDNPRAVQRLGRDAEADLLHGSVANRKTRRQRL
jgi:hypothetical protein